MTTTSIRPLTIALLAVLCHAALTLAVVAPSANAYWDDSGTGCVMCDQDPNDPNQSAGSEGVAGGGGSGGSQAATLTPVSAKRQGTKLKVTVKCEGSGVCRAALTAQNRKSGKVQRFGKASTSLGAGTSKIVTIPAIFAGSRKALRAYKGKRVFIGVKSNGKKRLYPVKLTG